MERLEFGYAEGSSEERSSRGRGKKRKWREIEALKEKFRLRKELQDIDWSQEYELEELDV